MDQRSWAWGRQLTATLAVTLAAGITLAAAEVPARSPGSPAETSGPAAGAPATAGALSASSAEAGPAIPPSPSSVPGVRIWPDPAFTHWPAVVYADETRNASFALPVKVAGTLGAIGWEGDTPLPFALPADTDRISGLVPLPLGPGVHTAVVTIGTGADAGHWQLPLRVVAATDPWPLASLRDGFPVDEHGVPVVLVDRRRSADREPWALLRSAPPRPGGRALIVGDPMEALGATAWDGLDADARPALDDRYPQHAVLVALAKLDPAPRTIVWCPGNQVLYGAAWNEEEERLLGVVSTHCAALGLGTRLVLAAPPLPLDADLAAIAAKRRDLLMHSANLQGWVVIDLAAAAGDPAQADQVSPGLYTRYPNHDAQQRMRAALAAELQR
jgi:hypothetical protein